MKKLVVLFLSMFLSMAFAIAQKNVTGKVVDEKGESLPGVNILVKGSSTGCITDVDGKFSL
ncbi:MAG: carboxypeptidase-like regulatory domain-containing protein, partial [Breznakibacter sp.]|nr:carboxypeptidase-like regulatory domain-containing protein [Breznakibacter sp.]